MAEKPAARRFGDQPIYVGRTVDLSPTLPPIRPGAAVAWGTDWYWECHLDECSRVVDDHGTTQTNDDAWGYALGPDSWAEALRQGLEHLATRHAA